MVDVTNNKVRLDGKVIGILNDNGCLIMKRVFIKHHYHVLDAWCINEGVYNYGFKSFQINTSEKIYKISLEKIKAVKSRINMWVTFKEKAERQLAIPVSLWDIYYVGKEDYPSHIGIPVSEFFDNPEPPRWKSRLIANSQADIFE